MAGWVIARSVLGLTPGDSSCFFSACELLSGQALRPVAKGSLTGVVVWEKGD